MLAPKRPKRRIVVSADENYFRPKGDPYAYKFVDADTLEVLMPNDGKRTLKISDIQTRNPSFLNAPEFVTAKNKFVGASQTPDAPVSENKMLEDAKKWTQPVVSNPSDVSQVLEKPLRTVSVPAPFVDQRPRVLQAIENRDVQQGLIRFGLALAGGAKAAPGIQYLAQAGLVASEADAEEEYFRRLMSGEDPSSIDVQGISAEAQNKAYARFLASKEQQYNKDYQDAQIRVKIDEQNENKRQFDETAPIRSAEVSYKKAATDAIVGNLTLDKTKADRDYELRSRELDQMSYRLSIQAAEQQSESSYKQALLELNTNMQSASKDSAKASEVSLMNVHILAQYQNRIREAYRRTVDGDAQKLNELMNSLRDPTTNSINVPAMVAMAYRADPKLGEQITRATSLGIQLINQGYDAASSALQAYQNTPYDPKQQSQPAPTVTVPKRTNVDTSTQGSPARKPPGTTPKVVTSPNGSTGNRGTSSSYNVFPSTTIDLSVLNRQAPSEIALLRAKSDNLPDGHTIVIKRPGQNQLRFKVSKKGGTVTVAPERNIR